MFDPLDVNAMTEARPDLPELPDFDLDAFVPYQLAVTARQLSKGLERLYRDRFGISTPEWRVLVNVGYAGNPSVRDIERRVSLEKSKVSRAASRLQASGHLTKTVDPSDRRLVRLSLTPKGRALLAQIVPLAQAYQDDFAATMGADFDQLQAALAALMALVGPDAERGDWPSQKS